MKDLQARVGMLIRAARPAVFHAFTDKQQLCKFWLAEASDDLSAGATVEWRFMVPGARETKDERIEFNWSDGNVVELRCMTSPNCGQHMMRCGMR